MARVKFYRELGFLGFPGYRVGTDGSVWTRRKRSGKKFIIKGPWRLMKQHSLSKFGHRYVDLSRQGTRKRYMVHRLVLEAFVGPCPEGMECRHFPDRDPANNNVNNLQWGTRSENHKDCTVHGTWNAPRGERQRCAKLREEDVKEILRSYAAKEMNMPQLAEWFNVGKVTVWQIINRVTWKHVQWPEPEPSPKQN